MRVHTCSAVQPSTIDECPACQAWMDEHADLLSARAGDLIGAERTAIRDAMAYAVSDGGLTADQRDLLYGTAQGSLSGDPAAQWDTERDAQRRALRTAMADPFSVDGPRVDRGPVAAVRSVLQQVRRARPTDGLCAMADGRERVGTLAEVKAVRSAMRAWPVPSAVRADMRTARDTLQTLAERYAREACDNMRPDAPAGGTRWTVAKRADARTLAGPVVHTHADGTVSVYRVKVTHTGKGETRAREVSHLPVPMGPAMALTPDAVRMVGTRWSPDASTTAADRFTSATAPRGPVVKPSTRKRRRDGAIGGPMIIG